MRKVDVARWERYANFRDQGLSVDAAAKRARMGSSSAYRFEAGDPASSGIEAMSILGRTSVGGKIVPTPLSDEASKALADFAFFRLRYFGRRSTPWQERAAYEVLRRHESEGREYVVMNEPPGSGKSTLFTHDIPVWMIARNRGIRIMLGARTGGQAKAYLSRIKKTLERPTPLRAPADALENGTASDAVATLAGDFGPFKPDGKGDVWSAAKITVRQLNGMATDDKEPTVSAYGQDEGFLGGRYDVVLWDDLVDRKNSTRATSIDTLTEWWMTEAETRLEPGGLLILQGQRISGDDLYRFCLDMKTLDDEPKYSHVVYPSHDESRCNDDHAETAKPWPEGCLLDPVRLPYRHLMTIKRTSARTYDVQYQQNDGDSTSQLVEGAWLAGGPDSAGLVAPGCYDSERPAGAIDPDDRDGWSVVTVDPSPTKFWAVGWWVVRPEHNRYVLGKGIRAKMGSQDFLSMDLDTGEFSGILEELRRDALALGCPITHVVVEYNAAQRYLVTQPHVIRWQSRYGITIIPHQTHANKNEPQYGVTSIADYFRQGAIRVPLGDVEARNFAKQYASELTRWPSGRTDDTVMMTWFMLMAVRTNYTPKKNDAAAFPRPEWIGGYHSRGLPSKRPKPSTPAMRLMNR
jgi:hypothetical protein